MSKDLKAADTFVRLTLAIATIICYFTGLIHGPFSEGLLVIALLSLVIFLAHLVAVNNSRDK
ncbi:MAG TPA: hypothetical protein VIM75_06495 [Ohtaekwangia sp.]|uniref:hypothetical protein n=1 Tax=Ohtaekwangia sp. TaxID=2066019 RepID=UPI002F95C5D9